MRGKQFKTVKTVHFNIFERNHFDISVWNKLFSCKILFSINILKHNDNLKWYLASWFHFEITFHIGMLFQINISFQFFSHTRVTSLISVGLFQIYSSGNQRRIRPLMWVQSASENFPIIGKIYSYLSSILLLKMIKRDFTHIYQNIHFWPNIFVLVCGYAHKQTQRTVHLKNWGTLVHF